MKRDTVLLSLPPLTSIRRLLSSEALALSVFSWISFLVIHVYAAACIYLSFFRETVSPFISITYLIHIVHLLCTALSWAVQYRPVYIVQSIPVSSAMYLNEFPCLNASIVFLVSDVAVVLGPWCVVHRSTWQVNEELGGPAKIRDGGFVGVWEPLLCGHSSASSTDEVSGQCFHSGSHRLGESDAGVLQPYYFPS